MDDGQLLRNAMGLMESISTDERRATIQQRHHNEHLQALSLAAFHAVLACDPNALRTMLDTAFCLGVRAGKVAAPRFMEDGRP